MSEEIGTLLAEQSARLFERHAERKALEEAENGIFPTALWRAVEEAGLPTVLVPEDAGGIGGGLADAVAVLRSLGAAAAPIPLAETMLGHALLAAAGKRTPGEGPVAVGFAGAPARLGRSPRGDPESGIEIAWGGEASTIVVVTPNETGWRVHALPRGAATILRTRRNLAGEPHALVRARLDRGNDVPLPSPLATLALLKAAQISGALARVLEIAVGYANERVQFGRPIAKFQALQQLLAEVAGEVAAARVAVDLAATSGSELLCAVAKARGSEAAGRVAAAAHQVLGAMGYTREYHLHPLTRRLWSWRDEAGDELYWHDFIATHAFASGAAADLWGYVTAQGGA